MKEYVRQLLAQGKIEEVLQQLLNVSKQIEDRTLLDEIIHQSAQYKQYAKAKRQGTSSLEDQKKSLARINQALLEIIPLLSDRELQIVRVDKKSASKKTFGRFSWHWIVSVGVIIGILGSLAEVLNFIDIFPSRNDSENLQLTVFVTDTNGNVVLENEGRLNIPLGNRSLNEPIGINGRTNFPDIPANYYGDTILIGLEAEGWQIEDGHNIFFFTGRPIYLKVKKDQNLARITGLIKDNNGLGLADVTILIGTDTITQTDSLGRFDLTMPEQKLQENYQLAIQKKGYQSLSRTYQPNSNLFVVELKWSKTNNNE